MKDQYTTIAAPSEGQFKDKGSRFIAFAFPVDDEEEIKQRIAELKKKHHNARHHCYAWRLGTDMDLYRINDDGEPSGSAGKPIFGQVQSRGLTQILVVVVRYFGGTLLGVGGLINAYRSAASTALDRAEIIEKKVEVHMIVEFDYNEMNEVMKVVKEYELEFEDQRFDMECSLTVRIWKRLIPRVRERLLKISGCKITVADKCNP